MAEAPKQKKKDDNATKPDGDGPKWRKPLIVWVLLAVFVASLFGIQLNQMLFLWGLSLTSPIDTSIIATIVPVLTMILATLFLREPITWLKAGGVFLGCAGAVLLILVSQHGSGHTSSVQGDVLCISAGVAGMGAVIKANAWMLELFRWGGAVFLAVYGFMAAKRAWTGGSALQASGETAGSLAKALTACLAFTFLNPHVYLDTVVLLGSIAAQYGESRWIFAAGAIVASVVWFTGLGFGARLLQPFFANPKAWQVLDGLIAVVMWAIAATLAAHPLA